MEVFVGSQPIFNRHREVIAYELLYRTSQNRNYYEGLDGDYATTDVILNGFLGIGIEKLANGKSCFINFTENLLLQEIPSYFSSELIVIELLENILPNEDLLEVLKKLKKKGYKIVLDDFILKEEYLPFLPFADIIKIDFLQSNLTQCKQMIGFFKHKNVKLLAEKVETLEDYQHALDLGFHFFQGYFFSKPKIIKGNDLKPNFQQYLYILKEIDQREPNINKISNMIEKDLALTYRLLRLINSPSYPFHNKINSVKQAIMMLGLHEVKKWITVMMLSNPSDKYSKETFRLSLTRAKIGELIGEIKLQSPSEYFLLGLFSLIDTLLHRPMDEILKELPFSDSIKEGLLIPINSYGKTIQLIKALEKAEMNRILELCEELSLGQSDVFRLYFQAQEWANQVIGEFQFNQENTITQST